MADRLENYYANVVDSVGDGVIVLDNTGAVTLMNPAAEELTGVSKRQAMGHLFSEIFKDDAALNELVAKTVATGMSVADHENIVLKRSGRVTPVGTSTSPLLSSCGERIGTVVLLRDLTNVRELESAVRQADRLSSLGALAAGLAHEIKNPLGGIKGAAQLLEMEFPDNEDLREYVRVMLKEVHRVNLIVEELLGLASPGRLKMGKVNLHRVLSDIVLLQKNACEGKEVYLQQYFDPSIPPILADEALLTQLFLNLIKNAMEAVGTGGVVKVTSRVLADYALTQKGERRARMVAIDISDNGPGIAPEVLKDMFTPFFTTKSQGTGLGLAICQKIVSEHRGMIRVDSDPARGTVFTVMLPLIQ